MPSMSSLLQSAARLYPHVTFTAGERFSWDPATKTIFYALDEPGADILFLHELGHAALEHAGYSRDIELLTMERAAWDEAAKVAVNLDSSVVFDEDFIEEHLDTYRDWLHARSACPTCTATGYQTSSNSYECPACHGSWRVNEARLCGLKRYKQ